MGELKDKILTTEGYNMECVKVEPRTYAIWDLSATPEVSRANIEVSAALAGVLQLHSL